MTKEQYMNQQCAICDWPEPYTTLVEASGILAEEPTMLICADQYHCQQRLTMTPEQFVFEAVKARGYLEGYSVDQLLARQVCKLVEELGEAAKHVKMPVWAYLEQAARDSRIAFDLPPAWTYAAVRDREQLVKELTDMQVVLNVCEGLLNVLPEEGWEGFTPVSLQALALAKAQDDISRGVR